MTALPPIPAQPDRTLQALGILIARHAMKARHDYHSPGGVEVWMHAEDFPGLTTAAGLPVFRTRRIVVSGQARLCIKGATQAKYLEPFHLFVNEGSTQ